MSGHEIHSASAPECPELWPAIGQISRDRVATIGLDGFAFLYQGTNRYYDAYFHQKSQRQAEQWAELTDQRHKRFMGSSSTFVSAFVPNKATMLNEKYPFLLPNRATPTWTALKTTLRGNGSVLFLDSLTQAFSERTWTAETLWRRVDSHWSAFGCIAAVNSILCTLGLAQISPPIEESDEVTWGDLSSRWFGPPITERQALSVPRTDVELGLPEPTVEFDSAGGQEAGGVTGRTVVWINHDAMYPAHLVVVGNSLAGPGFEQNHLVWWFARLFRKVTFVHASGIPTDLMEILKPDALVFQGLERFLYAVPQDSITMADLERRYKVEASAGHG